MPGVDSLSVVGAGGGAGGEGVHEHPHLVRYYQVGGPETMRGQLKALAEAAEHPHITVQVVPTSAGAHSGRNGAFTIASFNGSPDVVYLESAREGQVTDRFENVTAITNIYDAIRAKALPDRASVDLITNGKGPRSR